MLRSDEMTSISLYIRDKNVRETLEKLGNTELIQFKSSHQQNISLILIEKLEQRLQYMRKEFDTFEEISEAMSFKEAEESINTSYKQILELRCLRKEHENLRQIYEGNYVMAMESSNFCGRFTVSPHEDCFSAQNNSNSDRKRSKRGKISYNFISAIVDRDKKFLIKKILRGILRGNIFLKMDDVDLKYADKQKTVYIVCVYGKYPTQTVINIIETMGGRVYDSKALLNGEVPTTNDKLSGLDYLEDIFERETSICKEIEQKHGEVLETVKRKYKTWMELIYRERQIYSTLNKLTYQSPKYKIIDRIEDIGERQDLGSSFVGDAWIRTKDLEDLEKLKSFEECRFYYEVTKKREEEIVPTSFSNNKFTEAFQNLTNVFGIPKYQEINPGIFMIFTFPLMFGVMFGDVLHGLILLLMSGYMIYKFDKLNHNCGVLQIILEGRYVILTCSFSSIWFGFIYSDFASRPIALFDSQFNTANRTYPFGLDPIWHHAANKMAFTNSLKMKLSLILGFVHMLLGSIISLANSIYENDLLTLYCVSIPQTIAFTMFLGYLVFLCIYKWLVTVNHPSIITTLIGMYTDPFNIRDEMFPYQMYVQLSIAAVIIACIPWMFFTKPMYLIGKRKVRSDQMLDLWINSGIHTIEFGLGLISNTSSYLRLWAVSLAHVQLTSVLHQFTIGNESWIWAICLSPVYVVATMLLLIGLEGLSSCLHALRLNWIEFFSKFYSGGGEAFEPLSFKLTYEQLHDL